MSSHPAILLLILLLVAPAPGATIRTVTNSADNGPGSLRDTIAASAAGDTIKFSQTLLGFVTIRLTNGPLAIGRDLTINGLGARRLVIDGNLAGRVFHIHAGTVRISDLTIANGHAQGNTNGFNDGEGGGIYNADVLVLTRCIISSNTASGVSLFESGGSGRGGGIYNKGALILTDCSLSHNGAGGRSGRIFSGAGAGGAIFSASSLLFVTNCTLSGNNAVGGEGGRGEGGGLSVALGAILSSCTIVSNSARGFGGEASGGGVTASTNVMLHNSIVSGNTVSVIGTGFNRGPDIAGAVTSHGFNLIGMTNESSGWIPTDLTGSSITPLNANVGPLQYNGGSTPTMGPSPGSAAIDAGNSRATTTDQRGAPRPNDNPARGNANGGDGSDIGAYEIAPLLSTSVVGSGSISTDPFLSFYAYNAAVTVTALAAAGSAFNVWSGDANGTVNPMTVTLTGNKAITATFVDCVTTGLIAWWNAEGTPGDLVGDNNGVLTNGATFGAGKVGQAFRFDGANSSVVVPDSAGLSITGPITIEAWLKADQLEEAGIVTKGLSLSVSYLFELSNGRLTFTVVGEGGIGNNRSAQAANPLPVGQWTHVAATFNPASQTMKLYLNGAETPSTVTGTTVAAINDTTTPVIIGGLQAYPASFPGLIDEVSIYNAELTPAAIQDISNRGIAGKCAAPFYKTLSTPTAGSGAVNRSPNQSSFLKHSTVRLTAAPAPGWFFGGWEGDASGVSNPLDVVMTVDKIIAASFTTTPNATLGVGVLGAGTVVKTPDQPNYLLNASVTLTANPAPGWGFSGWSDDATGEVNPLTVAMTRNKTIIANFHTYGFPQRAYLKASNSGSNDFFGRVAISGDTVVVGSLFESSNATGVNGNQNDNSATNSGAAYIFVRNGDTWTQQAYLKSSNTEGNDRFGNPVAISGNTVVVGASAEDSSATGVNGNQNDNTATNSGAAYVFVRNGTTWTQQAYLKASNTEANDFFGSSVAVDGDTIVVAANGEDSNASGVNGNPSNNGIPGSGAAYVFVRNGTNWTQQAYLKASNPDTNDFFGQVALSGDTLVVGVGSEDSNATGINGNQSDNSAPSSGAAYIFMRNGTFWAQRTYLKASNSRPSYNFGGAVAVSGGTIIVGSSGEASNATGVNGNQADTSASTSGAAYIFVPNGTSWSQHAYLKASNTGAQDLFGVSVAISDEIVVIGAHREDSNATEVNGNQADNTSRESGAAYVFMRNGTTWSQRAYLKAFNSGTIDVFGEYVGVSGGTVVVGAKEEDSNAAGVNGTGIDPDVFFNTGAAYVFELSNRLGLVPDGSGGYFVGFTGIPGLTYRLQRASSLIGPWSTIGTFTPAALGFVNYHDISALKTQAFYRTVQP